MCFTMIIYKRGGIGALGYDVLSRAIKSKMEYNRDGYALYFTDYKGMSSKIRTLIRPEFETYIHEAKDDIKRSEMVHLHLRASTNSIKPEFVHLWEINDWNCSHNGILSGYGGAWNVSYGQTTYNYGIANDSLEFFTEIKPDLNPLNIESISKKMSFGGGWGVFLLSNVNKPEILVMSMSKSLKITYFEGLNIFSSDAVSVKESSIPMFGVDLVNFNEYYGDISNVIMRIDLREGRVIERKVLMSEISYQYMDY